MPFDLQTLDWTAEVRPIHDAFGNEVSSDVGRLLVRSDTGGALATCGPNFKPIQHQDVLDPVMQTLHAQGYELIERRPNRRDLEDLRGQRGAFVTTSFAKNGGIMRTSIITGDFINPTGPSIHLPDGPPTCFRQYDILNSHTGDYAAMLDLRYLVLKCMNGLASQQFTAKIKAKHTTGFSIDAFKNKVLAAAEMMETDTARFQRYIKTPLTREQAETYFKATIARLADDEKTGELRWSGRLVDDLLQRFDNEPQSVWGAYMAMTEWATHGDLRSNSEEVTSRVGRDERVARATRAPQFAELLEAA
jgi:hypothetical protein